MSLPPLSALLPAVARLSRDAGNVVMEVYESDFAVHRKADDSPVTAADQRAEDVILEGLRRLTPEVPVISEEAAAAGELPEVHDLFWLVDPLDGTKEFVRRTGEFTVNIALVRHGLPILGVVHAPALARSFAAAGPGTAMQQSGEAPPEAIHVRRIPCEGLTVLTSRSHGAGPELDAWLARQHVAGRVTAGSSLKFCLIAAGEGDVYPRFGPTSEWDTAAGQAVLMAAGGKVVEAADGTPLSYGKAGFRNPDFIAWGRR